MSVYPLEKKGKEKLNKRGKINKKNNKIKEKETKQKGVKKIKMNK